MAEEDLKEDSNTYEKCSSLKIDDLRSRDRGERSNDPCYDDERGNSDGQPLQAKEQ